MMADIKIDGVKKIAYWVPISIAPPPPSQPPSLRTRIRWRIVDLWDRRPHVHLGPCDHDGCC